MLARQRLGRAGRICVRPPQGWCAADVVHVREPQPQVLLQGLSVEVRTRTRDYSAICFSWSSCCFHCAAPRASACSCSTSVERATRIWPKRSRQWLFALSVPPYRQLWSSLKGATLMFSRLACPSQLPGAVGECRGFGPGKVPLPCPLVHFPMS